MTLTRGYRVHWFRLISDLRRIGMPTQAIANAIGEKRSTVQDWSEGAHPRHAPGERLIELWCTSTTLPRESVPTIAETDFRI